MRFPGLRLALFCLIFTAAWTAEIDTLWDDYVALLETFDKYGLGDPSLVDELNRNSSAIRIEANFDCQPSVSPQRPLSVNKLRPGDINVVGALGDSLTAANGAGAKTLIGVATQYRGLAAGIGGDRDLTDVVTLPNILRKYNAELYGYSVGTGSARDPESRLNVAIPGATADDMPDQARELVRRLRTDPNVDFDSDWKVVTIFIGGNDLCRQCKNPERLSPENYVLFVEEAVMILSEVPRTFVNVIGILEVYKVAELTGLVCDVLHQFLCPCGMNERDREIMRDATAKYQSMMQDSINSGKFDRTDFAAVFQPFFLETSLPRHPDGSPDYSFFAPDCFHLSEKSQGAQAIATWNNMMQPVGSKDKIWVPGEDMRCPSEDFPYLYTNTNSKASWNPDENESQDEPQQEEDEHGEADEQQQEHDEQQQQQEEEQEQQHGDSPPADKGGLSAGAVTLIVISVLIVVTGLAAVLIVRRRNNPTNPYQQL